MSFENSKKVLIALDYDDQETALAFVKQLSPDTCRLKVGKEMFTYFGPEFVKELIELGFDVFLDLKFHDIPNTVAKAVTAAAKMGVWMVNVHASGGYEMMHKAKLALEEFGDRAPILIAVTVLTSMDEPELKRLGINKSPQEQVIYLARYITCSCGDLFIPKRFNSGSSILVNTVTAIRIGALSPNSSKASFALCIIS